MRNFTPARHHVIAVLVALTAFLIGRSWLQVVFREKGLETLHAADLSYLIAWPLLLFMLLPVLRENSDGLRRCFDLSGLTLRLVLNAVAIGMLIRLAWWCQLIAGISFGIYSNDDVSAIVGPQLAFQCPQWSIVALGVLVMAILVPVTEELINRGFVQSALHCYGPPAAIVGSTVIFTIFHPPSSWVFVAIAGVILGTQFWITKSLWSSLTTHATINALIQLDWRCLRGQWNPASSDLPLAIPGTVTVLMFVVCASTICTLLWNIHRGNICPGESRS